MSVLYIPCQDSRSIIPEHMSVNKQRRATDGFERASNKNRSGYILTVTDTKRKHEERKEGSSTDPVRVAHACARLIHGRDTPHTWVSRHTDRYIRPFFRISLRTRVAEPAPHTLTQPDTCTQCYLVCTPKRAEPGKDAALQRDTSGRNQCVPTLARTHSHVAAYDVRPCIPTCRDI